MQWSSSKINGAHNILTLSKAGNVQYSEEVKRTSTKCYICMFYYELNTKVFTGDSLSQDCSMFENNFRPLSKAYLHML